MDAKQIEGLIGKEVYWEKNKVMADIVSYEKGWVTIRDDEKNEHKVRAKELVLMDSDEEFTDDGIQKVDETDEVPMKAGAEIDERGDITCGCGTTFEFNPRGSRCPTCGTWVYVRLKPDMTRYVKGMGETPSGRDTVDIDDEIAALLRGDDLPTVYKKAGEFLKNIPEKYWFSKAMHTAWSKYEGELSDFLAERYSLLNNGMQRMNVGNLLRGASNRSQSVNAEVEEGKGKRKQIQKDMEEKAQKAREEEYKTALEAEKSVEENDGEY